MCSAISLGKLVYLILGESSETLSMLLNRGNLIHFWTIPMEEFYWLSCASTSPSATASATSSTTTTTTTTTTSLRLGASLVLGVVVWGGYSCRGSFPSSANSCSRPECAL